MKVLHSLRMDLARCGCRPIVGAVQGEANTRVLEVSLYDNGVAWNIPGGAVVDLAYQKPDGTKGIYGHLPDGSPAITFSGNVLTAILAPQVLTCPGSIRAAFVFTKEGAEVLATFPFTITVEANPAADAVRSEDYYDPIDLRDLQAAVAAHAGLKDNPHETTAEQVGALPIKGGTMTGDIDMGGEKLTNLATPASDLDAVTKKYVDDGLNGKQKAITGLTPGMVMICNSSGIITTSQYVDTAELRCLDGVESNIQGQLDAKAPGTHTHGAGDITSGTLPLERGGTGANTARGASYKILSDMTESTADVLDASLLVFKYSEGSTNAANGAVFYKKAPLLAAYIGDKLNVAGRIPKLTKLWTNGSSSSNFADQVLAIDVSGHDFIMVRYKVYKTSSAGTYHCAFIKVTGAGILETVSQSGKYRGVSFPTEGGVRIGNVYNADDTEGTNDFLIPYEIYGCDLL